MGAIAGGAIGNTIGGGSGRALATAAGVIGGAMFGNSIEAAPPPIARQVTNCTTQMSYENRITAYHVVYEYGGKQYSIQLPNDPGPYLPVNVTPSVLAAPPITSTTIIMVRIAMSMLINTRKVAAELKPRIFMQIGIWNRLSCTFGVMPWGASQ